jgi:hypothetical protein
MSKPKKVYLKCNFCGEQHQFVEAFYRSGDGAVVGRVVGPHCGEAFYQVIRNVRDSQ